ALRQNLPPLRRVGRCRARCRRTRHRAVAREVLFRLALDAPGHRVHHHRRRPSMNPAPSVVEGRREYLDWLRGVAVLIMIEAHTLDSWTRVEERTRPAFGWAMLIGGFGAPIFLFLAGISLALAAGSRV